MSLNLSPTSPMEQIKDEDRDHDQHYEGFNLGLNHHIFSSSSSSLSSSSSRIIFNSSQDQGGLTMEDYYAYHGRSSYGTKNTVENGLRVRRLWKKEDEGPAERMLVEDNSDGAAAKIEVKKVKVSCCLESDLSSPSIRVCSDCHTTKTPLWRSGPKGPKSLCNACGIRQRKARRAMAAATCSRAGVGSDPPTVAKVKEKMGESGHSSQLKKRCKLAAGGGGGGVGSSTSSGKYISFEDFLISLRNKLSFHRVLPQDEKEAAILLMALSSGLVHG